MFFKTNSHFQYFTKSQKTIFIIKSPFYNFYKNKIQNHFSNNLYFYHKNYQTKYKLQNIYQNQFTFSPSQTIFSLKHLTNLLLLNQIKLIK